MLDRSNIAAIVDAHLASAREHFERGVECHRQAADEIIAAMNLDDALSYRKIGVAMGLHHTTVSRLVKWRQGGAVRTTTPFGGDPDRLERAVKQALRDRIDLIASEAVKDEDTAYRLLHELHERMAGPPVGQSAPIENNKVRKPILRDRDIVKMGEHALIVGDSTDWSSKLALLRHAGLSYRKERESGEMDAVVVTDQPYGQGKEDVTNDDRANWGEVYDLFRPRGGFVFCAFHPPYFRLAEEGILEAGGKPVHYLLLDKGGGRPWNHRVQNRLDAVIYFERNGEVPWLAGRGVQSSFLNPKRGRDEMEERKRIGGGHATPKYIDVLITLIKRITRRGDIVLDPFTGSGTTLIACHRTGRRFLGVELEPKWAERAVRNWRDEPGTGEAMVHRGYAEPISFAALEQHPEHGVGMEYPLAHRKMRRRTVKSPLLSPELDAIEGAEMSWPLSSHK